MISHIERLVRGIGILAACLLIPGQVLVSLTYLLGSRLLKIPLTPLQELEWHFFFALVFLTLGSALLADHHVRIDILRARFPERIRARIEIAGFLLALLPFCLAVIYFGALSAWDAFLSGERSRAALGLPYRWIIKSMVPLGGLLLLLAGCAVTARNFEVLARPTREPVPSV
ncbi:MAG: TRAP transporter small permease subunit [Pseudomonadota bacterium]